jgi:hypothetical protein
MDIAVNRAERMRWRAFNKEARAGRYENYKALVALSLEAHTIRDAA